MNTSSTDDTTNMTRTFSSWQSYRLHILFSGWDISTPWQFALSFFAVMAAAAVYHGFECILAHIEHSFSEYLAETNKLPSDSSSSASSDFYPLLRRPKGWGVVQGLISLLSAIKYALALMIMLVAMTMNPCLFLALFLGYMLGVIVLCDFRFNYLMGVYRYRGIVRDAMQYLLCTNPLSTSATSTDNFD
eukprot:gene29200-38267_t